MTTSLPERAQADLLVARKARDVHAVTALRTLLAALANAEAPPVSSAVGSGEVDRLVLDDVDHRRILDAQIAERVEAATEYDRIGQADAAAAVCAERAVLERYR